MTFRDMGDLQGIDLEVAPVCHGASLTTRELGYTPY